MKPALFFSVLPLFALLGACHGSPSEEEPAPALEPSTAPCPASVCRGPQRGKRPDGSVDITADEVWPSRPSEQPPLTASEQGEACAVLAGCYGKSDSEKLELLKLCLQPLYGAFWEERAVPTSEKNERWAFEAREVLARKSSCEAVLAVGTRAAQGMICEEAGCWWRYVDKPQVRCDGDVATLSWHGQTHVRDCSRAFARCDASSQTGCTDRRPTACTPGSADRCDGAIRIGCDGSGKVSFHDCSRIEGATCGDTGGGSLGCVVKSAGECQVDTYACDAANVVLCVAGKKVSVPLAELGLGACVGGKL